MNTPPEQDSQRTLTFENGNQARMLIAGPDEPPEAIVQKLGLEPPYSVILVTGSADKLDDKLKPRLAQLLDQGVARAAAELKGLILDGGTQAGVMELMGQGVADQERRPILLGVAPRAKVFLPDSQESQSGKHALDPNHTHFVLVDTDRWSGATKTMFGLAEELAAPSSPPSPPGGCELQPPKPKPRVRMVLLGGSPDQASFDEALTCVRRGWPLTVVEGSGRLADQIAGSWKNKQRIEQQGRHWWWAPWRLWLGRPPGQLEAPLHEVVQAGKIQVLSKDSQPEDLRRTLKQQLTPADRPVESILHQAWRRYALCSYNAKRHQRWYRRFRSWALMLGVLTTFFVLVHLAFQDLLAYLAGDPPNTLWVGWLTGVLQPYVDQVRQAGEAQVETLPTQFLRVLVILLPILTSGLLTAESRLKLGTKWIALRAAAESILGGIYSYRVLCCCPPADKKKTKRPTSGAELAGHLRKVTTRLVQTEVTDSALASSSESIPPGRFVRMGDDGFSAMNGEMYVRFRLLDQLDYFRSTTNRLERQAQRYRTAIWVFGGLGTLLAAVGREFWLPLTAAIVTAVTAYLESQQIEQNLLTGNQSEAALANVLAWWVALPEAKREQPETLVQLVDDTESVLESDVAVWVQQMMAAQARVSSEKESK